MANDINVSMGLDDSEFKKSLDNATQAVQKFSDSLKRNTDGITKNLKSNTTDVINLTSAFGKLQTALLATFSAKSLVDMAEWANNIRATGAAVGMTSGELIGLQSATMQAGGTALAASRGIEMFYMKLDQARQGGYLQQEAFRRIGISLDDLAKYDDKELFNKTIHNLAQMAPSAERNRLEVELLSKSFRGVPLQDVAKNMDELKGKFDQFSPVIDDASKAYNTLQQDITNFKIAVLEIAQPLMKAFADLKFSVEDIRKALEVLLGVLGAVVAAGIVTWVLRLVTGFTSLVPIIEAATVALTGFAAAEAAATGGATLIATAIARLAAAGIGYVIVQDEINSANDKTKKSMSGLEGTISNVGGAWDEVGNKGNKVYDATAKINAGIRQQTQAFIENVQVQINAIQQREKYIGLGEIERAKVEETIRVYDEYARKIQETQVKLKEAKAAGPSDERSKTVGTLEEQLQLLKKLQVVDSEDAGATAAARQKAISIDQMKLHLLEDQIKLNQQYQDIQLDIENATATADEKRILALVKEEDQYIRVAMAKRRAQLGTSISDEDLLKDEQLQKYITDIDKAQEKIREATKEQIAVSRQWNTGWKAAMDQYVEDATNAANASKTVFDTATKGMEDAFVNFAKTGKLSFSDMTAAILEEILRIQIRMIAAGIMNTSSGSGGLSTMFGGIKKLFGFAQGGVVPGNAPIIVGERGPEIFTPAGGGTITPNNQLNSGASVTYNINAVDAASFKSMLARDPQFLYALTLQGRKSIPGAA